MLKHKLMFIPTAEGYVSAVYPEGITSGDPPKFAYVTNLRDHLGNLRMSLTRDNGQAVILQERHYYPFGLLHRGYNEEKHEIQYTEAEEDKIFTPQTVAGRYKYWYNGKEWQEDLNLNVYDYGARQYDPAVGRWFTVDPAAEIIPFVGQFVYVFNSPLFYNDPTGLLGEAFASTFIDETGKVIEHRNDGDPTVYLVTDVNKWEKNGKKKDGLAIVGYEDWRKVYRKGDKYTYYNPREDPEYNGQYLIPASAYDYSEEVIEGKFEEDWAYILHGTEGTMIYRFYKILERDITAQENRGTVISAGSDVLFG